MVEVEKDQHKFKKFPLLANKAHTSPPTLDLGTVDYERRLKERVSSIDAQKIDDKRTHENFVKTFLEK